MEDWDAELVANLASYMTSKHKEGRGSSLIEEGLTKSISAGGDAGRASTPKAVKSPKAATASSPKANADISKSGGNTKSVDSGTPKAKTVCSEAAAERLLTVVDELWSFEVTDRVKSTVCKVVTKDVQKMVDEGIDVRISSAGADGDHALVDLHTGLAGTEELSAAAAAMVVTTSVTKKKVHLNQEDFREMVTASKSHWACAYAVQKTPKLL